MQICFLSNYFNHHQKPLSDSLYEMTFGEYYFVATSEISEWRKKLGYQEMTAPYVLNYNSNNKARIDNIILSSDVVIIGAADRKLIQERLKKGGLTFLCTERIYWESIPWYRLVSHYIKFGIWYRRYKNLYLLCASAFTYQDFLRTHTFKNKAYKWGYFPPFVKYNCHSLIESKEHLNKLNGFINILWVGRLIDWKHPESCIVLAEKLKQKGYRFRISMIGIGDLETQLKKTVKEKNLDKEIDFLGSMSTECVRKMMDNSSIFLATSNEQEGWGAVLNEAMNSACAVVTSNVMGSAPYLVADGFNGLLFDSGNWEKMANLVEFLIINSEIRKSISFNAYSTIEREWNASIAALRLLDLSKEIKKGEYNPFTEGPCSKA